MANYYCACRTNYFRVTDEERYKQLYSNLYCSEDIIYDFTKKDEDGTVWHGFGAYSSIDYKLYRTHCDDSGEYEDNFDFDLDFDAFLKEIQQILPDDEAFIYMETGHEKLRYVTGHAVVATKNAVECIDITASALLLASKMLGDPEFQTVVEY